MRKLILACMLLLILTNIAVLAGVAYNRSGEPVQILELTERELPISQSASSKEENSGTTLSLQWQILDPEIDVVAEFLSNMYGTPAWLNDEKLTALGFDMKKFKSESEKYRYRTSHLASEVVLVLEYQGESYDKALALAKEKEDQLRQSVAQKPDDKVRVAALNKYQGQLTRFKISQTRLYAVDAGLDEQVLTEKYAGKKNYLLARGEIGLDWHDGKVSGRIRQIYIRQVHVPLPLSEQLTAWTKGETYVTHTNNFIPPRYSVRLNIGKRLEPWIESVAQMESGVEK
jgi:hypothetical protein